MRRSAAPSQLQAAKRAKFIVPYSSSTASVKRDEAGLSQTAKDTPGKNSQGLEVDFSVPSSTPSRVSAKSSGLQKTGFTPPAFISNKKSNCNSRAGSLSTTVTSSSNDGSDSPESKHRSHSGSFAVSMLKRKAEIGGLSCDIENTNEGKDAELHEIEGQESKLCTVTSQLCSSSVEEKSESETERQPLSNLKNSVIRKFQPPSGRTEIATPSPKSVQYLKSTGASPTQSQTKAVHTKSQECEEDEPGVQRRYLAVVWCKLSKKKHKKWEGDAVLVTHGRRVTLFDMDGKEIGKGSGYKSSELESLAEDETLVIGGKEIQVMSKLSEEQYKSGKCFSGAGSVKEDDCSVPSRTNVQFKSFTNPVIAQKGATEPMVRIQNIAPKFDPTAPDALVMPRPTSAHQWQHNKQHAQVVDVVVDPHLCYHLRPHQRDGVVFLYECAMGMRNYGGTGAILADDMGLGKTLQCITLIWTLLKQGMYDGKPPVKRVLIITPGSLVKNWSAEFRKWLGPERLQVFVVSGDKRVEEYVKTAVYPVLIISYEMFVRGYDTVKTIPFDLVVCDEGHRLKNSAIKTTSLINSLDTRRRVVLSGTPIQNDLQEFFAVVDFCNPGVLGSSTAFGRVYEKPILASRQPGASKEETEIGDERATELSRITHMFVLRRTQEVNNKYLPPKVELVLFCRPSPLQVGVYKEILRSSVVRSCLLGRGLGSGLGAGAPHLLAIAALKQICNHPRLIAPKVLKASLASTAADGNNDYSESDTDIFSGLLDHFQGLLSSEEAVVEHSGKLAALAVILNNIFNACPQDKVVLVSNHTKTLDLLQQFCISSGYQCARLDGQTPTAQRQEIVTRFNSSYSQHRIFLLSSKAGGVGLNLVGASRLFLYDIDWNPANDLQAMARVWRDGQKKEVHIYRLLTTGSLEEKVYQRQISKQSLSGAVMDMKTSNIQFSQEDLKDLFSFSEGTLCDTHTLLGCTCDGCENVDGDSAPLCAGRPSVKHNLSMAELLDWEHLRGSSPHIQKNWCLEDSENLVSFLFWHKTNTSRG